MTYRPPTVALVYVTLKSVQSSHFVLSRTVPTADGGIPRAEGLSVEGGGCAEVLPELLDEPLLPLLALGLMMSTPTGTKTAIRMIVNKMIAHMIPFFVQVIRFCGGWTSGSGSCCIIGSTDFSGGGTLVVFSVGSTKGFSADLIVASLGCRGLKCWSGGDVSIGEKEA